MIVARSQYDERGVLASDLDFNGDRGLTKQADAKDCDINAIFKRYERCGQLPDMIVRDGRYGDFSEVPSYQEACEIVRFAEEQFLNLDVSIRNRFENDPVKFLAFVHDAKNVDEIERMGLLKPEAVEARRLAREKAMIDGEAAKRAEAEVAKKAAEDALVARIKAELSR